ncbi:unnamed protein product [Spodoptera littoralis]|uniref:HAT C-terminal dimerisation domain-containing protein n=1 Tax=Spodoptera littoralis TaxID=7109 RepID=A0A9P0HZS9_SPOLI|nr:unnamed protein product [Spodoptera littoralis]CAH1637000.1 unnamed protein product [Spodoptera littoralis]
MKKVGKSVKAYHQKCLAHGIQLAILDVLYKKTKTLTVQNDETQNIDDVSDDDENDDEKDENGTFNIIESSKLRRYEEVIYEHVINKVRKVAKLFRKSPTKQTILNKYVEEDFHRELKLIIDCKTRWSSLAEMLERFLKLKICVRKALIDIGSGIEFTESEYSTLEAISDSLNILKVTLEALCRRDANLLTADTALNFCLQKLNSLQTSLSVSLANSLCTRIKENRLIEASILQYLHNPSKYFENKLDPRAFNTFNNDEVTLSLKQLYERLNKVTTEKSIDSNYSENSNANDFNDIATAELTCLTAKEQLACELENLLKPQKIETQTSTHDLQTTLHVEKALFENGGDRGKHLNQCYNYLLSIPPTSVEAERAFSNAGYFCNKIRSSLSEKSLNALCFLRAYFKNEKC